MRIRNHQQTERQIAAGLRLTEVAVLLLLQIFLVIAGAVFIQRYVVLLYGVLQIGAIILSLRLFTAQGHPTYRNGWILLLLLMPAVGLPLYWSWSSYAKQEKFPIFPLERQETSQSDINLKQLKESQPMQGRIATYLQRRGFLLYHQTQARYFSEGQDYWEAIFADLQQAKRFIFLEYFIVAEGELLDRLYDILRERVQEGVEVKLICDDFGNMFRFNQETLEKFREAGIAVRIFNPVHKYVNRLYFNYRDHRKIACVDGRIAYTGGANLADEYANLVKRYGYWKDSGVRLEGEGAWGFTRQFLAMWKHLGGTHYHPMQYYHATSDSDGEGYCQPFADGPQNNPANPAEDTVLQMLATAKESVWLTSPYFVVDETLLQEICRTAESGIQVGLILPSHPDHLFVDLVAEDSLGELMRHGVQIYRYTPGFVHSKTVLVDGALAMLGTVNLDFRSFQLHYECGVLLYGGTVLETVQRDVQEMVQSSYRLSLQEWEKRPLWRKLCGRFMRIFAVWL